MFGEDKDLLKAWFELEEHPLKVSHICCFVFRIVFWVRTGKFRHVMFLI